MTHTFQPLFSKTLLQAVASGSHVLAEPSWECSFSFMEFSIFDSYKTSTTTIRQLMSYFQMPWRLIPSALGDLATLVDVCEVAGPGSVADSLFCLGHGIPATGTIIRRKLTVLVFIITHIYRETMFCE